MLIFNPITICILNLYIEYILRSRDGSHTTAAVADKINIFRPDRVFMVLFISYNLMNPFRYAFPFFFDSCFGDSNELNCFVTASFW